MQPRRPRTSLLAILATAGAALVGVGIAPATAASTAATTSATAATTASAAALDTGSRQAVTAAYRALWLPATTAPVELSGGDAARCTPYRTSATTQARTLDAVNLARELAGMRPVTSVTDAHTAGAALSALLQAANQTLTHTPAQNLLCWTLGAATAAARSNLDLRWSTAPGYLPTVADIVGDYLVDRGSTNTEVGHRRWLLLPQTTTMGSGNALSTSTDGTRYVTNDLWVVPTLLASRPAGTPAFYGWPAAGWFPSPLEPEGRWSLSSSTGASFAHAHVSLTRDGAPVPVSVQPYATGYGDNTLVWQLARPAAASGATAQRYDVTVTGITGGPASSYSYSVRLFDPSWTDPSWTTIAPTAGSTAAASASTASVVSGTGSTARRGTRVALRLAQRGPLRRLRVAVAGAAGIPDGRVVVSVDGHRAGRWTLRDGRRTVRLAALGRAGRHHVLVRYTGGSAWAPSAARMAVRVRR